MPASRSQKKKAISILLTSFGCKYYPYDVTCWLLAPVDFLLHLCLPKSSCADSGYAILCNLQLYLHVAAVCVLQ